MEKETRRGLLIGLFLIIGFGVVLSNLNTAPQPNSNDSAESYLGKYYHVQDVVRSDGRSGNRTVVVPGRRQLQRGRRRPSSSSRGRFSNNLINPNHRATINVSGQQNRGRGRDRERLVSRDNRSNQRIERRTAPQRSEADRSSAQLRYYTVKRGDKLFTIAQKVYGRANGRLWKKIAAANRSKLGSRNRVMTGQKLLIPSLTDARTRPGGQLSAADIARRVEENSRNQPMYKYYVVKRRDNLTRIARDKLKDGSRSSVRKLYNANRDKLKSINSPLRVGMKLKIPS